MNIIIINIIFIIIMIISYLQSLLCARELLLYFKISYKLWLSPPKLNSNPKTPF